MQRRHVIHAAAAATTVAVFATALSAAGPAAAQTPRWPDKPVKILVGFPPGQATDIVARLLADRLQRRLSQPFIVENKAGQGGSIALAALAKAPPDGYTLMLSATASLVVNPHLYKSVGYETLRDFAPVATVVDLPMLLVAHPSQPFRTLAELQAYAKANPGKLKYSSSGNGTLSHLGMEVLKRQAGGLDMVHIPYQGSARSMADLVAGIIDVGFDTVAVTLPQVQAGKMRAIAVSSPQRLARLPEVPTLAEAGVDGPAFSPWLGLLAPRGTPADVVARLGQEVVAILRDRAIAEQLAGLGAAPRPGTGDELRDILSREYEMWGRVVRDSGARVE